MRPAVHLPPALPPASPPAPVAAWLLQEIRWYVQQNSPALCYLRASLRAGCPAAFAVWMRDRLWTRAVSGWIDPVGPGAWTWVAEHPCWLERVTLSLTPEDGCSRHMTLRHTLPTPLERGHRLTFWMAPGEVLRFDLGEGLETGALPGPAGLRLVEIRYRRRLP